MIRKFFTLLPSSLLLLINSHAQTATVTGRGEGCNNATILFYKLSDPVSKKLLPLTSVNCNGNGEFQAEIPVSETTFILFRCGSYRFSLIVREGKRYEVAVPAFACNSAEDENYLFGDESTLIPEVLNDSLDINNLIRIFDSEFNVVFNRVAERIDKRSGREKIPELVESLNRITGVSKDPFFRDFVNYRLVMLNTVAWGEYPGRVQDSVIINREFNPFNPAYTDLIEQLYSHTFRMILSGNRKEELSKAIAGASPSAISAVLSMHAGISDPLLQQYVILMNTFYGFYDGYVNKEYAAAVFDSLKAGGGSKYIRNLASVLGNRIDEFAPGTFPPPLSLPDSTGRLFSVTDLRGKPTLVAFIRNADYSTAGELPILKNWWGRYSGRLNVVAVITGRNFRETFSKLGKLPGEWIILNASDSPFISDIYELKIFPSFLLLDAQGRIAVRYCPPPSENMERLISGLTEQ